MWSNCKVADKNAICALIHNALATSRVAPTRSKTLLLGFIDETTATR